MILQLDHLYSLYTELLREMWKGVCFLQGYVSNNLIDICLTFNPALLWENLENYFPSYLDLLLWMHLPCQ